MLREAQNGVFDRGFGARCTRDSCEASVAVSIGLAACCSLCGSASFARHSLMAEAAAREARERLAVAQGKAAADELRTRQTRLTEEEVTRALGGDNSWDGLRRVHRAKMSVAVDWSVCDADPFGDGDQRPAKSEFPGDAGQILVNSWSAGADFNPSCPEGFASVSSLLSACYLGDVALVEKLLRQARQKVANGEPQALFHLLERRETLLRFTPLLSTISGARIQNSARHTAIAKLLIDAGARVTVHDVAGYTPVHHCTFRTTSQAALTGIFPLLIAAGADVNARTRGGRVALTEPVMAQRDDCVTALMEAGADPTIRDLGGFPPTAIAMLNKHATRLFEAYVKKTHKKNAPTTVDSERGALTGRRAVLEGLQSRPELNGVGCLCGAFEGGRYAVTLDAEEGEEGESVRVKPGNLKLPLEALCAAPGCTEKGRKVCSRCLAVSYCGAACSAADWSVHKPLCTAAKEGSMCFVPETATVRRGDDLGILEPWSTGGADQGGGAKPAESRKFRVKVSVPAAMVYGDASASTEDIFDPNSASLAASRAGLYHCKAPLLLCNEDSSVRLRVAPDCVGYEGLCSSIREHGPGRAKAYFFATRQGGNVCVNFGEVLPVQPW